MTSKKDAIIIGGGVIGCSIALSMAQSGLKVAIFERGRAGEEASWAAAGMLSPQTDARAQSAFFDLCMSSRSNYRSFASSVAEISGIDPQYQDDGILCVALTEDEACEMAKWSAWQKDQGLSIDYASGAAARDLEPEINVQAHAAAFIPADHQIENRRLMEGLSIAVRRVGVEINEAAEVEGLIVERGRARGILHRGEAVESGVVVMAAGCWSGNLLKQAGVTIPVLPARGQMLALKGAALPFSRVIHGHKCYLVPRRDNRIVVGSTIEYVGFHKGITAMGIASLLSSATDLVPLLKDFEVVETWSGLRPDTTDHLPVLGPCDIENLYLATGHFRNGILLAPITAQLITQCIVDGSAPDRITPFSASRFAEAASGAI